MDSVRTSLRSSYGQLKHQVQTNPSIRRTLALPLAMRRHVIEREKRRVAALLAQLNSRVEKCEALVPIENMGMSFYVDTRSHNLRRLMLFGEYEPHVVGLIDEYMDRDRDFIDVGANVGFLSAYAATLLNENRRVLSMEPTPRALELLRRNVSQHGLDERVLVTPGVVTDKAVDEVQISTLEGKEEYSSVNGINHPQVRGEKASTIKVKGYTIDDLVDYHELVPGFLKIDTEGHEDAVLAGAQKTISKFHPVILSELSDKLLQSEGGARAIIEQLRSMNYKVLNAEDPAEKIQYPFVGEIIAIYKES